jgi:uncharacterized protein YciW
MTPSGSQRGGVEDCCNSCRQRAEQAEADVLSLRQRLAAAVAEREAQASDAELLEWMYAESLSLECQESSNSDAGDKSVYWHVIEYRMDALTQRSIGIGSSPREALRDAATKRLCLHANKTDHGEGLFVCDSCGMLL